MQTDVYIFAKCSFVRSLNRILIFTSTRPLLDTFIRFRCNNSKLSVDYDDPGQLHLDPADAGRIGRAGTGPGRAAKYHDHSLAVPGGRATDRAGGTAAAAAADDDGRRNTSFRGPTAVAAAAAADGGGHYHARHDAGPAAKLLR